MVTESEYRVNGKYMGAVTLYGLSTDTKPLTFGNGSMFIEIDNVGKLDDDNKPVNYQYCFDAENATWYPVAPTPEAEATPEAETKVETKTTRSKK